MVAGSETVSSQGRASRIVAEALVEGYNPEQIAQRAHSMGLSRGLTDVLLAACPCQTPSPEPASAAADERPGRVAGQLPS